jgi:hypothetical protein
MSMAKLLNEETLVRIIQEELDKSDVIDIAKKDKNFEKRIKEICVDVVNNLFKLLWQRRNFYDDLKR